MKWNKRDIPAEQVKDLAAQFGCDLLTASILARRGLCNGNDALYYLESGPSLLRNPFDLPGMEDAVDRILAAKEEGEKLLVFGDRDVDGISATTLLSNSLEQMGFDLEWRIPTGDDTYGLSIEAIDDFAAKQGTLIITVDCGVSNVEEIAYAASLGIDVIVTDHHTPPERVPDALAIVNPKLEGSRYGFQELAGCGVAYKLASALRFAEKSGLYGHTICLLNARPANEALIIEAVKLRNLAETGRITEMAAPGMVKISETRLPAFLEGCEIFVWDAAQQQKALQSVFGRGVEFALNDLSAEIVKTMRNTANPDGKAKSLLRLREESRFARYAESTPGEIDVFINLFRAFIQKREKLWTEDDATDLQYACLGTVADLMPLRDENRIIVRAGLAAMNTKLRPGLSELIYRLGLSGKPMSTHTLAWKICPPLNAAGRMGCSEKAAHLLLSKDAVERDRLASEINALNEERKQLETETWDMLRERAEASIAEYGGKMAVVAVPDMKRGLTGLIAGRMANAFQVPSLALSLGEAAKDAEEAVCTGSFRSYGGYDLTELRERCSGLFLHHGGHPAAAGFSMLPDKWPELQARLKGLAPDIELPEGSGDGGETVYEIDAELPPAYLTPDIFKLVDRFEPSGKDSEPLQFLTRGIRITGLDFVGKNKEHVKLTLDAGKNQWPALYWNAAEKAGADREFNKGDAIDLVYALQKDWFNGQEHPQMIVADAQRSPG